MQSQKQVANALLTDIVQAMHAKDVNGLFGPYIDRAAEIVRTGGIVRLSDGTYECRKEGRQPYSVYGTCDCPSYEANRAPGGWCKHRIAAKIYRQVDAALEQRFREGTVHQHTGCAHEPASEPCWERNCQDAIDQACADCTVRTSAFMVESQVTAQYEPNPQAAHTATEPPRASVGAMPEAPASLNIKLKLPKGGEIMYTMRSMHPGAPGDAELQERLPSVLAWLTAAIETESAR